MNTVATTELVPQYSAFMKKLIALLVFSVVAIFGVGRFNLGEAYHLSTKELRGADIFLDEPSVTGTENALTAAVAA